MVTGTIGKALWAKFAGTPATWLDSTEGDRLATKAREMIRDHEGDEEAQAFWNLIEAARCLPV